MTTSLAILSNTQAARPGRLIERLHRDIGLAAVARGLELSMDDLEPELSDAVKRGARYIYLTPKPDCNLR
jgi:hypothetical protein